MTDHPQDIRKRLAPILLPLLLYLAVTVSVAIYTGSLPELYETTATVFDQSHQGGKKTIGLSNLTSTLASEEIVMSARLQTTEDEARRAARKATTIKVSDDGTTTIRVRTATFGDARDLANAIALHYQGSTIEENRREVPLDTLDILTQFPKKRADLDWLLLALQEQAKAAGFDSFREVGTQATLGNGKAATLFKQDDFAHRLEQLEELRTLFEPPGSELRLVGHPPLRRLDRSSSGTDRNHLRSELAFVKPDPVPPNTTPITIAGQIIALILAGLLFFTLRSRSKVA